MPSAWSQDTYIRAYRFAAEAHWNETLRQCVPGTDLPYLMHVSFVAMEVIAALSVESGHDGDVAIQCALLHDTIEDTAISHGDLLAEFGPVIADGVLALTKDSAIGRDLPKAERKTRQMEDSLRRIIRQPKAVWMVKMADRITNLQPPPGHWSSEKIVRYRDEATGILSALRECSPYLEKRLAEKIDAYPIGTTA
ncbi:HD domain-containing protein [Rhodospira trueperi]|uniref:HD domain-containing protein n=1 Tax=Rhodospira trueperi TaxID=69960 RepID=A0A1G7IGF2_9PROT|nr:HD domain-containing protein [Rhodospira trueperi]SDF11678.1 HD domain-containing protein [Rhodospira trueperi]